MNVYIASSKTDQYREGQLVPIASTGSLTCPVAMLRMYRVLTQQPMCATKKGESLRAKGSLSYTRIRELVLAKFKKLGYKAIDYGLHSFRAGGATSAVNCPDLPEGLFKCHGRWRSERGKEGYVKDLLAKRLKVSKSLEL